MGEGGGVGEGVEGAIRVCVCVCVGKLPPCRGCGKNA